MVQKLKIICRETEGKNMCSFPWGHSAWDKYPPNLKLS